MKITRKVVLLLGVVTFPIILGVCLTPQTEAQTSNNTNQSTITLTKTNFAQQISQQISLDTNLVNVVYESPETVILQGSNSKTIEETRGLGFNDLLWRAVDLLKDKGFAIDKIDLLPAPENPELLVRTQIYQIYMSRGE